MYAIRSYYEIIRVWQLVRHLLRHWKMGQIYFTLLDMALLMKGEKVSFS